ncbi:MAG: aldo/keto reductase [Cypionkella sp.]
MTNDMKLKLNDGKTMPQLGFGVWQVPDAQTAEVVGQAIRAGYGLIDTATGYNNEKGVGTALAAATVPRSDLFVTTKLANKDHGFDSTLRALETSLALLGTDYVDLYLIHWPRPAVGLFVDTWKALVRLQSEGRARSIGVSNFTAEHLQTVIDATGVVPAVNQIELHPRFQQAEMREFHAKHGIITQSWSPLGRGHITDNKILSEIGAKYGKSWAQVVIRWHLQSGLAVIPKSVTPERIIQNRAVFDFTLSGADMAQIASLDDTDGRAGPHPDKLNG